MEGKIKSIGTALPYYSVNQQDILRFMGKAYNNEQDFRKLKILYHQSGIDKRHSVLPDFGMTTGEGFFKHQQTQPDVQERMNVFKDNAIDLALSSAKDALEKAKLSADKITHVITVTCTGMYAPGISNEIVRQLKLRNDIFQTSVNFLGCNAAFHALKIADLIAKTDASANILVVTVELCTIHFQPKNNTDNLISNTIFGDGAATALITSSDDHSPGLQLNGLYSMLLHHGEHLMGWDINPQSFEMVLNAQVPKFIGEEITSIMKKTLTYYDIEEADISQWAVHPGGKKILDQVKSQLNVSSDQMAHSYQVLHDYGNLSSATILFVLNNLLTASPRKNEKVMAVGFGPGLSVDTLFLTYV